MPKTDAERYEQRRQEVLAILSKMAGLGHQGLPIILSTEDADDLSSWVRNSTTGQQGDPVVVLGEDGRSLLVNNDAFLTVSRKGYALIEERVRREWAQKIRDEFDKYHVDSAEGSGECGACGAKQAANWMDPDFTQDGPTRG